MKCTKYFMCFLQLFHHLVKFPSNLMRLSVIFDENLLLLPLRKINHV